MQPAIVLQQLCKNYGAKQVLNNINLEVMPGQIIGYIGPNGAGKSTTVKIITGILQDFEGTAIVNGINLKENVIEAKKIIGYVPELAELYDLLTPWEYLQFVGNLHHMTEDLIRDRAEKFLSSFGILENMNQRMDSFSKGMRQKVLLTSGLIHNPQIVVLDEPLSGLDANAVIMVKDLMQKLKADGKTIFYCSHMMDVVEKVSDKIILIDQGKIIANGTIEELRNGGNESLEQLFSKLTFSKNLNEQSDQIMASLQ